MIKNKCKIVYAIIALLMVLNTNVYAVTMYFDWDTPIEVDEEDVDFYKSKGYFYDWELKPENMVTMYSADGRTLNIPKSAIEDYNKVGWYTEKPITMYASDGRTLYVIPSEIELYKSLGWYTEPLIKMYAYDGRSENFPASEVEAQKTVGWYTEPFVTMYTYDGRSENFPASEVEAQKTVGWYTEPFVTMYTFDGRSAKFPKSEVNAQKNVGWYTSWEEIENIKAEQQSENQKNIEIAKKFKKGTKVVTSVIAYECYGTVKDIQGGRVLVNWDAFYDSYGYKITNQIQIITLESYWVSLNEPTWYNASELYIAN